MTLRLSRDDVRALVTSGRLAAADLPPDVRITLPLSVFVSGPLYNPMNGPHGHWSKHARWARQWRERTALAFFAAYGPRWSRSLTTTPKLIRFLAHTGATWDDDNLRAGLKPLRDALIDYGMIQSDAPAAGHQFVYGQRIDRAHRGVRITVEGRP